MRKENIVLQIMGEAIEIVLSPTTVAQLNDLRSEINQAVIHDRPIEQWTDWSNMSHTELTAWLVAVCSARGLPKRKGRHATRER